MAELDVAPVITTRRDETMGRLKTLISKNSYDEGDFWKIYDRAAYDRVKARTDPKNLFAMANLYEKFEHVVEAEEAYKKVVELNPNDAKGCAALAGFYNDGACDEFCPRADPDCSDVCEPPSWHSRTACTRSCCWTWGSPANRGSTCLPPCAGAATHGRC